MIRVGKFDYWFEPSMVVDIEVIRCNEKKTSTRMVKVNIPTKLLGFIPWSRSEMNEVTEPNVNYYGH